MDSNEELIKKRVVVDRTGQRSEVVSEKSQTVASPPGVSGSTVTVIIVLVLIIAAAVVYISINRANRSEELVAATQAPPTIGPQPAPAPAPVIIQQAAPVQPAPIIIQQPAQSSMEKELTSANEDANMQNLAAKKLNEDLELGGVVTTVNDARAVLTGNVGSEAAKAKAEQVVKAVRGMKSVDNKIVVSG
jgi:hypothetical protein